MKVAAFTGFSGSGKTTLITALIHHLVAEGKRVGAIKHTHHPLNEEHRGDTGKFRDAGADPVMLANDHEAVVFASAGISRVHFSEPKELLQYFDHDVVLIEGFKQIEGWPRHALPLTFEEALARLA